MNMKEYAFGIDLGGTTAKVGLFTTAGALLEKWEVELVLSRKLQEKRIFPAIDVQKSGTRREDLLLSKDEYEAMQIIRKSLDQTTIEQATDSLLNMFEKTKDNEVLIKNILVSTKHQK